MFSELVSYRREFNQIISAGQNVKIIIWIVTASWSSISHSTAICLFQASITPDLSPAPLPGDHHNLKLKMTKTTRYKLSRTPTRRFWWMTLMVSAVGPSLTITPGYSAGLRRGGFKEDSEILISLKAGVTKRSSLYQSKWF